MFRLKSYFKYLSRNKIYSFVNIFGFSVSLMFIIIIASYTRNEFTTDDFQKNADQIYVLGNNEFYGTAYGIGERLQNHYPEIEKVCGVVFADGAYSIPVEVVGNKTKAEILTVDSTFMDMFSFELLEGNRNQVLKTKQDVLVSEAFARTIFGTKSPIGSTISLNDSLSYTINGVIEDFENTVFRKADIIMLVENMKYFNSTVISETFNNAGSCTLFIQTTKGSDIKAKEADVAEYFKTFFWTYSEKRGRYDKAVFTPIRDFYFEEKDDDSNWNSGDSKMIAILGFVGILILIFTVINYVNITVAQTSFRAREMAINKLYGASKKTILGKIIIESSFLCLVAFIVGYFFAFALEPYASKLIGKDILLAQSITVTTILQSAIYIIALGTISGIVPALILSRYQPIDVLKGTFVFNVRMFFSKIFIIIQSVITVCLISCSIVIYNQIDYMMNYDYGYNHAGIIDISTMGLCGKEKEFREKLKTVPSVKSVGFTSGTIFDGGSNIQTKIIGVENDFSLHILSLDSATVKMLGIEMIKDNNLAEVGYWTNQTALDKLGLTDDAKSFTFEFFEMDGSREIKISGVLKEFKMGDLITRGVEATPLIMRISDDAYPWNILVQVQGDLTAAYKDVKEVYKEVTGDDEFTGEYLSDQIERSYKEQKEIQMLMIVFAIIAIVLSSLGLLAISSYFILQRSKEIALRKVYGSTKREVLTLLIWKFMRLNLVGFVIACPIVWYSMNLWLNDFSYRIDLSIWVFIIGGLFNLLVAFFTVYWQSNSVANANPTKSIMN